MFICCFAERHTCFPASHTTAAAQVSANYTCAGQPMTSVATGSADIAVTARAALGLIVGNKQPALKCGNEPAVAAFRYTLRNIQPGQDYDLSATTSTLGCTAQLIYNACLLHFCREGRAAETCMSKITVHAANKQDAATKLLSKELEAPRCAPDCIRLSIRMRCAPDCIRLSIRMRDSAKYDAACLLHTS
jgi:hypothetical protein